MLLLCVGIFAVHLSHLHSCYTFYTTPPTLVGVVCCSHFSLLFICSTLNCSLSLSLVLLVYIAVLAVHFSLGLYSHSLDSLALLFPFLVDVGVVTHCCLVITSIHCITIDSFLTSYPLHSLLSLLHDLLSLSPLSPDTDDTLCTNSLETHVHSLKTQVKLNLILLLSSLLTPWYWIVELFVAHRDK